MRRLMAAVFGMILGGGLVYFAFQYHLVRTEDEVLVVPKREASLVDPYADVRRWRAADWNQHPELVDALVKYGRSDLVLQSETDGLFHDLFRKLDDSRHGTWWPSE